VPDVRLVWAQSRRGVIGNGGAIPWRVPEDLRRFSALTSGGVVLMGRRTWESLPPRFRPLPERHNLVLTRDLAWTAAGADVVHDVADALRAAAGAPLWVIGGGEVYRLTQPLAVRAEVTEVDVDPDGDTLAPVLGADWLTVEADPAEGWHESSSGVRYRYRSYRRAAPARPGPLQNPV
jgi:dihydrofolate reductase